MLNRSDTGLEQGAVPADIAQFLRGGAAFGAVAFYEGASPTPDQVGFDAGYADCLPVLGGGCWRDPSTAMDKESLR